MEENKNLTPDTEIEDIDNIATEELLESKKRK